MTLVREYDAATAPKGVLRDKLVAVGFDAAGFEVEAAESRLT